MPLPEKQLIARIKLGVKPKRRSSTLVKGIGDDCAVLRLPAGHEALVTTDFSLEGVHFRREWHPAEAVGHRCLARGLSDIAAMGGKPVAAFLSLALPAGLEQRWVDEFMRGFTKLAKKHGVALAGGDTAQSPELVMVQAKSRPLAAPLRGSARDDKLLDTGSAREDSRAESDGAFVLADVMVLGSVPRGKAVLRSGAKVGDDIYVTGQLGIGVAALNRLIEGEDARKVLRDKNARKHFYPEPRVGVGEYLRERGLASGMIDISDGLSTDLAHICDESGVDAWIAEEAIPVAAGATLEEALHGGDEYELIFTARPSKHKAVPARIAGVPITWIGTVTKPAGVGRMRGKRGEAANRQRAHQVWLVNNERGRRELKPQGWQHFRGGA